MERLGRTGGSPGTPGRNPDDSWGFHGNFMDISWEFSVVGFTLW